MELIKKNSKNPLDTYKITDAGNLDLSGYSHIYIGTGIYAGGIPQPVAKYISKHKNELIKKTGYILFTWPYFPKGIPDYY